MAFADYDAYIDALDDFAAAEFVTFNLANQGSRFISLSELILPTPPVPTTSIALDKSNIRAINGYVPNGGSGRLSILGGRMSASTFSGTALIVVDILNISGGMNATLTTAQTTNIPTAALTRYTSGDGVHAGLIVHNSSIGTTVTTVTCQYTNQNGTSSRTTTEISFGGANLANNPGNLYRLPLQAGDTGVRSVESVTLAGSTGAAGNFGVVLYKPLAMLFANDVEGANAIDCVSSGRMVGQFNEVLDDACLGLIGISPQGQNIYGCVFLGEA